jgi:hypothetical protein
VKQSLQVLEWQAEARQEGEIAGQRKVLLEVLKRRFKKKLPAKLVAAVHALNDEKEIGRWVGLAVKADSWNAFRRAVGQ